MTEQIIYLSKGFGTNLLVTALSAMLPLLLGTLLTFFATKSKVFHSICSWVSLPFECFCPLILLVAVYYLVPTFLNNTPLAELWSLIPTTALIVAVFSYCFLLYLPARVVKGDSFLKNLLVNGLGLISAIFKWSFVISFVGQVDLLQATSYIFSRNYDPSWYIIPLVVSTVVILDLELIKRVFKQFLK